MSLEIGSVKGFFQVLTENDQLAFLSKLVVDQHVTQIPTANPAVAVPMTSSVKSEVFYLVTNQGELFEMGGTMYLPRRKERLVSTTRKRPFIKTLRKFKPEVDDYMKQYGLSVRFRTHIIQVFKWVTGEIDQ